MAIKTRGTGGRSGRILGASLRTLGRTVLNRLPGGDRVQRTAEYWANVGDDWVSTLAELRGAKLLAGQRGVPAADLDAVAAALNSDARKQQ